MTACVSLPESPSIFLITGLMAAGKSTVAQALAERLPRSVHLRGDVFRRMIVSGRAEMGFELSEEAERQLRLRYRIAAAAADLYFQAGFTVVHQDIVLGQGLAEVAQHYAGRPLHVVVLCPDPAVVAAREAGRAKSGYGDTAAVVDFDRVLRAETPRLGLWLDTSDLTVGETVDRILARLSEARVGGAGVR
ncbi:AAA family ATPase [Sorangium sp. So ce1335]|uniref:AAA family ATPase n=1 Tax=Sorangium sp. So ce1335 TaxID=3133335 RepID=UPI003F616AC9